MAKLDALLTHAAGVPLTYSQDRAAIDRGVHLFVQHGEDYSATQGRVWFQAKGKRASTLSLTDFESSEYVDVSVQTDHLRFWFGSPEPVYLIVYIESAEVFIAEDVQEIVIRQWPDGDFYKQTDTATTVTVHLPSQPVFDVQSIVGLLRHRSMRIDGPAFQGRPLGHRYDPLRSQLKIEPGEQWTKIVSKLLDEFHFRPDRPMLDVSETVRLGRGRFYDTMIVQSGAFAEYGWGPNDDFRNDPPVQFVQGAAVVILDSEPDRSELSAEEVAALSSYLSTDLANDAKCVLFFAGMELSGTGGNWLSFFRENVTLDWNNLIRIGHEALSSLVLSTTMVYVELAPELSFAHVNYRY